MSTYTVNKYYLTLGKEYFQPFVFIRANLVVKQEYDTKNNILNLIFH